MDTAIVTNAVDVLGSAVVGKMYSVLDVVAVVLGLVVSITMIIWGARSFDAAIDS